MSSTSVSASSRTASALSSNLADNPGKLLSFTLFPKMPLELREMVWSEVCFHERVIDIWNVPLFGMGNITDIFGRDDGEEPYTYKSSAKRAPSVLHTSKESRTTALKFYCLEFGTQASCRYRGSSVDISTPAQIYVNWKCDIICPMSKFEEDDYRSDFVLAENFRNPEKYPKLRRIAFPCPFNYDLDWWVYICPRSKCLREVILYPVWSEIRDFHDEEEFVLSKNSKLEFLTFDEDLDESEYKAAGYCESFHADDLGTLQDDIKTQYHTCRRYNCEKKCGEGCEEECEEHICEDFSHLPYPFEVNFKILKDLYETS